MDIKSSSLYDISETLEKMLNKRIIETKTPVCRHVSEWTTSMFI